MKKEDVLRICPRFAAERRGERVLCRWLNDDLTTCKLPTDFTCQVMVAIENERQEREAAARKPVAPAPTPEQPGDLQTHLSQTVGGRAVIAAANAVLEQPVLLVGGVDVRPKAPEPLIERPAVVAGTVENVPAPPVAAPPTGGSDDPGVDAPVASAAPETVRETASCDVGIDPTSCNAVHTPSPETDGVTGIRVAHEGARRYIEEPDKLVWTLPMIECGLDCIRKFFLRHVANAPETGKLRSVIVGQTAMEMLKGIHMLGIVGQIALPEDEMKLVTDEDVVRLEAAMKAYGAVRPFPISEVNVEISGTMPNGWPIKTVVPGVNPDGEHYDFRYLLDDGGHTQFTLARQASLFISLRPSPKYNLVILARPRLRRSKDEALDLFKVRLEKSIQGPNCYLKSYPVDAFDLPREMLEITVGAEMLRHTVMVALQFGPGAVASSRHPAKCNDLACQYAMFCEASMKCLSHAVDLGRCHHEPACKVASTCIAYRSIWK